MPDDFQFDDSLIDPLSPEAGGSGGAGGTAPGGTSPATLSSAGPSSPGGTTAGTIGGATPGAADSGTSGLSATPDQSLDSLLPLLQSAGNEGTSDVFSATGGTAGTQSYAISPSDLAAMGISTSGLATGADVTSDFAGTEIGQDEGNVTFAGQFSPTSATSDPALAYLWGQGDKTTSVDSLRSSLEDPAWATYNQIIQQYPQLAGQEINPDALAAALRGSSFAAGGIDPETNLPAYEGEIQDLLLNQPGVVAARGGYEDVGATPAEIAAGNQVAQGNFDYMQKYGDETPTQGLRQGVLDAAAIAASYFGGEYFAGLADTGAVAGGTAAAGSDAALGTGAFSDAAGVGAGGAVAPSTIGGISAGETALGQTGFPVAPLAAGGLLELGAGELGSALGGAAGVDFNPDVNTTAADFAPGSAASTGSLDFNPDVNTTAADFAPDASGSVAAPTAADLSPTDYLTGSPTDAGAAATTTDPLAAVIQSGGVDPYDFTAPSGSNVVPDAFGGSADIYEGAAPPEDVSTDFNPDVNTSPSDYAPDDTTPPPPLDTSPTRGLPETLTNADSSLPGQGGQGLRLGGTGPGGLQASGQQLPTGLANAGGAQPNPSFWDSILGGAKGLGGTLGTIGKIATPLYGAYTYLQNRNAIKNAANQIQQSTNPAQQTGNQLLSQANAGQLTSGQQAALDQWTQSSIATIKQYYINAGQSASTAESLAENYVGQTALAVRDQQLQSNITEALNALGLAEKGTQAAVTANLQGDQQLLNSIFQFMNAYGNLLGKSG